MWLPLKVPDEVQILFAEDTVVLGAEAGAETSDQYCAVDVRAGTAGGGPILLRPAFDKPVAPVIPEGNLHAPDSDGARSDLFNFGGGT